MSALEPFTAGHEICEVASDDYDPARATSELAHPRAKLLPFDPALLETSIYRFSPPPFRQVYRERCAGADLRCYLNANVLGIKTDASARTVTRLAAGTLSGVRFEVAAKHYVLAAGGIEMRGSVLSNDVVANGLGNGHDLVGRYFMEHPHTKRSSSSRLGPRERALRRDVPWPRDYGADVLPDVLQRQEGCSLQRQPTRGLFRQDSQGWLALRKAIYLCRARAGPIRSSACRLMAAKAVGRQIFDMVSSSTRWPSPACCGSSSRTASSRIRAGE